MTLSPEQWGTLLEDVDPPTYGEIVAELADRELIDDDPDELLEAALEAGTLVEDDGGAFPSFFLTEHDGAADESDPAISNADEEPDDDREASSEEDSCEDLNSDDVGPYEDVAWSSLQHADPAGSHDYEAWMPAREKKPWNPGAATENQWSWSNPENWTSVEKTQEWLDMHPFIDGRAFILQGEGDDNYNGEPDPYLFVDYDDVADGDGTEPAPEAIELMNRLGLTYTDYSTSGTGLHQIFRGELPDDVRTIQFELPNGAGEIEIYDCKRVCIMAGKHVADTPVDPQPVDEAVLEDLADEHGKQSADVDREDWEPPFDRDDLESMDSTDNIDAIFDAIQQVEPRDIRLRSDLTEERADGVLSFDPSWAESESGTRLGWDPQIGFIYRKGDIGLNALQIVALEEGIITNIRDYPRGADWWRAVKALRDRGAHIPEYAGASAESGDVDVREDLPAPLQVAREHGEEISRGAHAVLPNSPKGRALSAGWDWRSDDRAQTSGLSIDAARQRTQDAIETALGSSDQVLIEALPTMGKSRGTIEAAVESREQVTILTGRGRKEQYEQFREWAEQRDLDVYTLPSAKQDCDTANGEHGDEWAERFDDWYCRGATPQDIHKEAEYELGHPLPCQEYDGQECPYTSKWRFEADDYDILLGHYSHAHKRKVVQGRTIVFDEFPGSSYESLLDRALPGAVTHYLQSTPQLPFDDYTDLIENRSDDDRRADALAWFEDQELELDPEQVFTSEHGFAAAPLAVFTILAGPGGDLGNGWERADLGQDRIGLFDREQGGGYLLQPPELPYTKGIVALDGTPTREMWQLALGTRLNHRQILTDEERREYITDVLNHSYVVTTPAVKPYNSADHVAVQQDAALLEAVEEEHDQAPGLITTATAEQCYASNSEFSPLDHVNDSKHYGNILGSNEFRQKRIGAVIGSNHFGDTYIEKWGAFAGEPVERNDEKGAGLSYGAFGDRVLTHMREHDTLQAVMRFGRDGNGAIVYVHTDTLPDWTPVEAEGRVVKTWSNGMRDVLHALEDLDRPTTADITGHPAVDLSRQQVFDHLEALREHGVLSREQDAEDGRRFVWRDGGLHRLGEHGDVELEPVDLADLDEDEVRQLARSIIYTWEFTNPAESKGTTPGRDRSYRSGRSQTVAGRGDPPPSGL